VKLGGVAWRKVAFSESVPASQHFFLGIIVLGISDAKISEVRMKEAQLIEPFDAAGRKK
jgi:hypothetical protein